MPDRPTAATPAAGLTDTQALQRCGAQCLAANDGRGRRWAVTRCAAALQANGVPADWARRYAGAVGELAAYVRAMPGVSHGA